MFKTKVDLLDGYEVISKSGLPAKLNLKKDKLYTRRAKTSIRNFIKPPEVIIKKDPSLRTVCKNSLEVKNFVSESLKTLGFSELNVEGQLQDVASMMFERFNINTLNCRMDYVSTDKCKKFHIDRLYLRSITTLMGPGTELKFADDPEKIYQTNSGETLLVKGSLFPGYDLNVLHRSPKISHLRIKRLIFVMDY